MSKERIINRLTLLDTASFRCRALCHNRHPWLTKTEGKKEVKEPLKYRSNLRYFYEQMTEEQLNTLYKLKTGEDYRIEKIEEL